MKQKPKVSVCIVTYNQQAYIEECLESVLAQQTDFPFEIIVGDDASTDLTRQKLQALQQRHPEQIRLVLHETNVGAPANVYSVYALAQGDFIAHLDGDDYMLPGKLQTQYQILQADSSLIMCTHDLQQVDENSRLLHPSFKRVATGRKTLADLYRQLPFFGHSSKMFRSHCLGPLKADCDPELVDIEIHVAQAKCGDIYHIDQSLGAYRLNVGVSTLRNGINPILPKASERIYLAALKDAVFDLKELRVGYASSLVNYAYQSAVLGDKSGFIFYIRKSVKQSLFSGVQVAMYLASFFPVVGVALCKFRAGRLSFLSSVFGGAK